MLSSSSTQTNQLMQYNYYVIITGAIASTLAIILLLCVLFSNDFDSFQCSSIFGVFGLLCGIAGCIMPLIKDIKSKIKGSQIINTLLLVLSVCCWFITAILWICAKLHAVSFCAFFVSILYLTATAFKMKADVHDDSGLEQSVSI